jgi:tagatose-1,6-bisphosphate aldolase non-catalytic subunit AgaZ/GatZ
MTFDVRHWLEEHHGDATLLGVCPMSAEVVEAALREAAATGYVPMFIATPRQVDADRGYTGWSQDELVTFVDETAADVGYDGPTVVARDHGGPYQSTRDRGDPDVGLDDAMACAEELFVRDLESGFDVLHVDATEDPRADGILDLDEVAGRTTELVDAIESERESAGHDPVHYEVGTEEITGGMTDPDDFERFIGLLQDSLAEAGRGDVVDRLLFAVGQTGTTMRIDMTNEFDPEKARTLVGIADEHGLFLKVHYTDWLVDDQLARFPDLGIGAANVGPEFAAAMVEGFESLERIERDHVDEDERSEFIDVFSATAVRDAPWEKFAPDDLADDEYDEFARENRRDIAHCVGRYVFTDPDVRRARETLYENVRAEAPDTDPHDHIVTTVQDAIHRYVEAFDLGE